jgi:hypothetical protein
MEKKESGGRLPLMAQPDALRRLRRRPLKSLVSGSAVKKRQLQV